MTRPEERAGPRRQGPVKVLLADDQALVRAGFKLLLHTEDDLAVVAEAGDGAEAVALARATRPDVVVMDIRMPVLDGIQATRELAAIGGLEQVRVLILTTYDTDAYVFEALLAGAQQPRDRRAAGDQPGHRPDPCQPGHRQARRPRPRPAGRDRPPDRAGQSPHAA